MGPKQQQKRSRRRTASSPGACSRSSRNQRQQHVPDGSSRLRLRWDQQVHQHRRRPARTANLATRPRRHAPVSQTNAVQRVRLDAADPPPPTHTHTHTTVPHSGAQTLKQQQQKHKKGEKAPVFFLLRRAEKRDFRSALINQAVIMAPRPGCRPGRSRHPLTQRPKLGGKESHRIAPQDRLPPG